MAANESKPSLLVGVLSKLLHSSELASIEILPGALKDWAIVDLPPEAPKPSSHFPFVFVEGNLGIPQKVLHALYLAAVSLPWRSSGADDAIASSSVIILLNPAHQTALNARKSLMKEGHLDPEKELVLMELISRGSPECAKQSIVWDHRRWCLNRIYGMMGPVNTAHPLQFWASSEEMQLFPKIGPAVVQRELALTQHTCETYPRNYHSWAYWHFIIDVCYASICSSNNNERQQEFLRIVTAECIRIRRWIEQHVSDYSAMHQLFQSLTLLNRLRTIGVLIDEINGDLTTSMLINHALSLVTTYPSHESLWMYLRVALSGATTTELVEISDKLERQNLPSPYFKQQLFKWFSVSTEVHSCI
ncbi:hypothetical protein CVT25_011567 [Psilocybe cyanescens]|uniref:Protein prenyltransferase alpha subunit repeat-containing protein 1 n=1 Tax=Psilocybe cyanescens TaxID=93625 RepID=A0A409XCD7_PSICY|nr:hypothetical protein CVT25_011567 [Psilocybe cyanescens]